MCGVIIYEKRAVKNVDLTRAIFINTHYSACCAVIGLAWVCALIGNELNLLSWKEIPKPEILKKRGGVWFQCGTH